MPSLNRNALSVGWIFGLLALSASGVASTRPEDFPAASCGVLPSQTITSRYEHLSKMDLSGRSPAENLELGQVLNTLNLIEPLRQLLPHLRNSEAEIKSAGLWTDYQLLQAAYDSEESAIQSALIETNEGLPTELKADAATHAIPNRFAVSANVRAMVESADLTASQAAQLAVLRLGEALGQQDWTGMQSIAQKAMSISCDAQRSLLWSFGNYWVAGSFGAGRKLSELLRIVNDRINRGRKELYADDVALLDLLHLRALLSAELKRSDATKAAVDDLLEFQKTGSAYNHLEGLFAELGELLIGAELEDAAYSAFVGALRASARHSSARDRVEGLMRIVHWSALDASPELRKELYRYMLDDPALIPANDLNRYQVQLELATAYDEDDQKVAAEKLRREAYASAYVRVRAQVAEEFSDCDGLLHALDNESPGTSELLRLARREEAYDRCIKTGADPIADGSLLLVLAMAHENHRFGATQAARDVLAEHRERIAAVVPTDAPSMRSISIALDMIADQFQENDDQVGAANTRSLGSVRTYEMALQEAITLLKGEQPWNETRILTSLGNAAKQAVNIGREQEVFEKYIQFADTMTGFLRTHPGEVTVINLEIGGLLREAATFARAQKLPLTAELSKMEKQLDLDDAFDTACARLGTLSIRDFEGRQCVMTHGATSGVRVAPPASTSLTGASTLADITAEVRRRAEDVGLDRTIMPTTDDYELLERIRSELRRPTTISELEVQQVLAWMEFVSRCSPYTERKRVDVDLLEKAAPNAYAAKALAIDAAVLAIKSSYRPAKEIRSLLRPLAARIREQTNLQIAHHLDWVLRWEASWTHAEEEAETTLHSYGGMDAPADWKSRARRDEAEVVFRTLIHAARFDEARTFLARRLSEDRMLTSGAMVNASFHSLNGVQCVQLVPQAAPILRECLQTYLQLYEDWIDRNDVWDPTDDPMPELVRLAAMTLGEDQTAVIRTAVHIGSRVQSETSRGADAMLRGLRARTELPESADKIQAYQVALRRYRKLDIEAAGSVDASKKRDIERARLELLEQRRAVESELRKLDELQKASSFRLESLQSQLRADQAMLVFYIGRADSLGIVIRKDSARVRPLAINEAQADQAIKKIRSAELKSGPGHDWAYPVSDSHDLYAHLIGPFESDLEHAVHLLIEPGPLLFELPFPALVRTRPSGAWSIRSDWTPDWLISKYSIRVVPDLAAYAQLREVYTPSRASRPIWVGGDPKLSEEMHLEPLPGVADELALLKSEFKLPDRGVLVGESFTEQQFTLSELHEYRVILLATHAFGGTKDRPPHVVFTRGTGRDRSDDGALLPSEAALLSLDADLVILSACRTGSVGNQGGDYNSLIGAFAAAGARSVVATHWLVESDIAGFISLELTRESLRSDVDIASALQRAMKRAMQAEINSHDEINSREKWRHPAFWAPFFVWGVAK